MTKEDILKNCSVEGNIVKLPPEQLDRKLYCEVAKSLELIGGKWKGGKTAGFVFPNDPTELLEQIANGEKRNLKKEYQFFATPDDLADYAVSLADIKPEHSILEPSAGQGAIIQAINKQLPSVFIDCCEAMDINQIFLQKIPTAKLVGLDFLLTEKKYDRIVANPPFTKNQDIEHIYHMFKSLKPNGVLVSFASKHWQTSSNQKEKDFRKWLELVNAEVIEIESGRFKASGTMVGTVLIKIIK